MSRLSVSLALGLCFATVPASAGVRVWEKNADNPDNLQYVDLGGFVQPGFVWKQLNPTLDERSRDNESGLNLARARINFKAQYNRYFFASFEFDGVGPALADSYGEFRVRPWLNFRAGQFLVPFLQSFQFNEVSVSFNDRQMYIPQTGNPTLRPFLRYLSPRDVGFMITGVIGNVDPASSAPVFEYSLGIFNGGGAGQWTNDDRSYLLATRLQLHILGLPLSKSTESDIARNPTPKVSVGLGGLSNCDTRKNWNRGFTTDTEFRFAGLYASASFVWFRNGPGGKDAKYFLIDSADPNPEDKNALPPQCKGDPSFQHHADGSHLQAQYALPASVLPESTGTLEFLARWDGANPFDTETSFFGGGPGSAHYLVPPNYDDSDNAPSRWRITLGANWYPLKTQSLRVSLNYQLTTQSEPLIVTANGQTEEVNLQKNLLWLQLTAGI